VPSYILIKRINSNSTITSKTMLGAVKEIKDGMLVFLTHETFDGPIYHEIPHEIILRTDNALGLIPFLPTLKNESIDPYENHIDDKTKSYFNFLVEFIELATSFGKENKAVLYFRCEKEKKGNEPPVNSETRTKAIYCRIRVINKSNVVIEPIETIEYLNGEKISINLLPKGKQTILYRSREEYLYKILIAPGKHNVSRYDEMEEF
jgi:hypothetical protein